MTEETLRAWAEAHAPAMPQAVWVLRLLAENADLRAKLEGAYDRVHKQSELLGRAAERGACGMTTTELRRRLVDVLAARPLRVQQLVRATDATQTAVRVALQHPWFARGERKPFEWGLTAAGLAARFAVHEGVRG